MRGELAAHGDDLSDSGTYSLISFSISDSCAPCKERTTPRARPPRVWPVSDFQLERSPDALITCASIISSGWSVLGLGGMGNLSDVPVLGGVKAERGRVGCCLLPLRRAPTPGDLGVGGNAAVLMFGLKSDSDGEAGEECGRGVDDERKRWKRTARRGLEAYILEYKPWRDPS